MEEMPVSGSSLALSWNRRLAVLMLALATFVVALWACATAALAAQGAAAVCTLRSPANIQMQIGGTWYGVPCRTQQLASSSNGAQYIRDTTGPICIYFGSTLAGCASKGSAAYVGNRIGHVASVRTQPAGS
jgi:hypothetical protein